MFSTFEKIKELAKKQGKSLGAVEEDLGYGRNTLYKIKSSTPNAERIAEIANYFNVSTDYLLGRTENPRIASNEDATIDFKEAAAGSMLFDGKPLNDDDIDFIAAVLEAHFKNKKG